MTIEAGVKLMVRVRVRVRMGMTVMYQWQTHMLEPILGLMCCIQKNKTID